MKHKSLTASIVLLAVGIALSVWGDATTLNISNGGVTVTSSSSTILNFPITRAGDTSYDAFLQYQTLDGTALAGTDYTAAMGSIVIPAGMTSATIPVTVAGSNGNPPDKMFQMSLLGGGGAARSFTSSFAAAQTFATGGGPRLGDDGRCQRRRFARSDRRKCERQHGLGVPQHHLSGRHDAQLRLPADFHT